MAGSPPLPEGLEINIKRILEQEKKKKKKKEIRTFNFNFYFSTFVFFNIDSYLYDL